MSNTQQPEALNLEEFRAKVTRAAREPLLARIAELEAQLSAIGAGGVEPLRKQAVSAALAEGVPVLATQPKGVFVDAGALQMVLNALERDALEGRRIRAEMRLALMQTITHPTQQGLDKDTQRNADIGAAIQRACKELPEGAGITISLERGAWMVEMIDWDGNEFDHFDEEHEDFACRINAATDGAIAAEQVAAQAKQGGAA